MPKQAFRDSNNKPKENLRQRAYLNSLTALLDFGAIQLTGFITSPFIIRGIGSTFYGAWQMLGQMTGYTNLLDIRASQVLTWSIAKSREVASKDELRSNVSSAFIITLIMLPLVLIAGGIISWYAPNITGVNSDYHNTIRITCALLVFSLTVNKVFNVFRSILAGMNLKYKFMGVRALIIMFGGFLKILAIKLGFGLIGLGLVLVFDSLLIGLSLYIVVKKNVDWYGFGRLNLKKTVSFGKLSGWFMAYTGVKMLLLNSDKIILGVIAGPAVVTSYTITMFVSQTVRGISSSAVFSVMPGIGGIIGKNDFKKAVFVRQQLMYLTWLIGVILGGVIILFNKSFITLWVGSEHFAGHLVNLMLITIVIQQIFFDNDGAIINITLNLKMKVFLSAVAALLTILLSMILVDNYGIIGMCISIFVGRIVLTIGFPYLVNKYMDNSVGVLSINARPFIVGTVIFMTCFYFANNIDVNSWIGLFAAVILSIPVLVLLSWFGGLNFEQRSYLMESLKKVKYFKTN